MVFDIIQKAVAAQSSGADQAAAIKPHHSQPITTTQQSVSTSINMQTNSQTFVENVPTETNPNQVLPEKNKIYEQVAHMIRQAKMGETQVINLPATTNITDSRYYRVHLNMWRDLSKWYKNRIKII